MHTDPPHSHIHTHSLIIMPPAGSTRWCPTPEQLMILEEIYRSGVRTPNASQIQQITAHLSYYGKVEGKNTFYWFQNHKARERQKLRRKLGKQLQLQQQHQQQILHHHQPNHCQVPNHPQQLFHCFQSPPALASSLPQGGLPEAASSKMTNYTWKLGIQERVDMEKSSMGMYGHDWMMLVDHHVAPPSLQPCCSKPPLKTLELFPITATNLKEESNNSSKQK